MSADMVAFTTCRQSCANGKCLLVIRAARAPSNSSDRFSRRTCAQATSGADADANVTYHCMCNADWSGVNCSVPLQHCHKMCRDEAGMCIPGCLGDSLCPKYDGQPCGGVARGTCLHSGKCRCKSPFGGDACESASCPNDCSGRGFCNSRLQKCLCPAGWSGDSCEIRRSVADV
jgi:tenascin